METLYTYYFETYFSLLSLPVSNRKLATLCEVLSGPFDRREEWGLKGWWAVPKLVTHSDHHRWSGTGLPTAWLWVGVEGPLEKGQGVSGSPPSNTGWGTFHKAGLCDLASEILLVWWKTFGDALEHPQWWTEGPHLWFPASCAGSLSPSTETTHLVSGLTET